MSATGKPIIKRLITGHPMAGLNGWEADESGPQFCLLCSAVSENDYCDDCNEKMTMPNGLEMETKDE